ncbi:MAG: DNA repair exonuclease [archaeon]|nr:DNA repair exonuclease [archaeon]
MKLGLFSDTHFGFAEGTERESECFENAVKALKICFDSQVDAILVSGDIFDESLPSPETLSRSFDVFLHAFQKPKRQLTIKVHSKHGEKEFDFSGIPVVAIHGNHDCRSIGKTNILEVFHKSGMLAYLQPGKAMIEKGGEKVFVHGLSAVPEKKARDVLSLWNPVPVPGCTNVLLLHQAFKEFLPFQDDSIASLSLEDLPKGFDLIVNGHLHWVDTHKIGETIFVLNGSTVTTQMKKLESVKEKGVFVFDTESKKLDFFPLPAQRKLFYFDLKFENAKPQEVLEKARQALQSCKVDTGIVPLARLKLSGSLAIGTSSLDVDLSEALSEVKGKAIVSVSKNFFSNSFKKKITDLRSAQKSKQSIASMGLEILEKNLAETDFGEAFDAQEVFELLSEDKIEEAATAVLSKK